jgi:hypothetical protein
MRSIGRAVCGVFLMMAVPAAASAQSRWIAPHFGATTGGDATKASAAVGISGGLMLSRWLGVEGDLADAPGFFEQDGFLTNRRVTTAMANLVVVAPHGSDRARPYLSGGLGLLRPRLTEAGELFNIQPKTLGWNVGGGVNAFVTQYVGFRADARYVHGAKDTDADENHFGVNVSELGFWRLSSGLVVRF